MTVATLPSTSILASPTPTTHPSDEHDTTSPAPVPTRPTPPLTSPPLLLRTQARAEDGRVQFLDHAFVHVRERPLARDTRRAISGRCRLRRLRPSPSKRATLLVLLESVHDAGALGCGEGQLQRTWAWVGALRGGGGSCRHARRPRGAWWRESFALPLAHICHRRHWTSDVNGAARFGHLALGPTIDGFDARLVALRSMVVRCPQSSQLVLRVSRRVCEGRRFGSRCLRFIELAQIGGVLGIIMLLRTVTPCHPCPSALELSLIVPPSMCSGPA